MRGGVAGRGGDEGSGRMQEIENGDWCKFPLVFPYSVFLSSLSKNQ